MPIEICLWSGKCYCNASLYYPLISRASLTAWLNFEKNSKLKRKNVTFGTIALHLEAFIIARVDPPWIS